MSDRPIDHTVLYWNRATPELYAVIREQAPPELEPVFLETEDPAEARAKLARAEFVIIADWALTRGRPRGRTPPPHGPAPGRRLRAHRHPGARRPQDPAEPLPGGHGHRRGRAHDDADPRRPEAGGAGAQRPRPGEVAPVGAAAAHARPRGQDARALRVRADGARHRPAGARVRGAPPRLRSVHHPHARGAGPVRRHRARLAGAPPPRVGRRRLSRPADRRDAAPGEPRVPRPDEADRRT